jgi:hypothetical protein
VLLLTPLAKLLTLPSKLLTLLPTLPSKLAKLLPSNCTTRPALHCSAGW